jgi:flagellar motor component MotA
MNTFFSWKLRWKHVLAASLAVALVMFIVGTLLWYFFLYLPMAQHLSENQRTDKKIRELQQLYELDISAPNATTTAK